MQPKHKLQHSNYTCSVCRKELPVQYFRVTVLMNLEAEDKCYRATCIICEASNVDKEQASETVRCKICEKTKPLHAFSPAKHMRKCDWACLDCEFPTCASTGCNARPDKAQTTQGWMCENCRYPPCITCGKKRPHRSHNKDNSVTAKPTWRCATCTASNCPAKYTAEEQPLQ